MSEDVDHYDDALRVARALLRTADANDPGMSAATHYSRNPKIAEKQRATSDHYAAYGVRTAVYAIFPELEDEPRCDGCNRLLERGQCINAACPTKQGKDA
jgi:hypothetical protein